MNYPCLQISPSDYRPLLGKVAIVTGSTSGIGLGIARRLAERGATVVLNGLGNEEEIEGVRYDLANETGVVVAYDPANIADGVSVARMVKAAEEMHGSVDILVNNAGIQHVAPLEDFPVEKWNQVLAVNLSGAFHAMRAAAPGMKARGWGRMINIASAHGLVASPFKSAYVAAKHGIIGLTKVAALEYAEYGITANAICPGYVWTPLVEKQIDGQARAHGISREEVVREVMLKKQPNKRFATVEELGSLVAFLATDSAQSITGAALPVDGGWTAE